MTDEDQYRERMRRKKAAIDRRIAAASNDKGLLLALVGAGMGKSSSAYGMVARSLGHGMRCAVARLTPGSGGELKFLSQFDDIEVRTREADCADAHAQISDNWLQGRLNDPSVDLVVLDGVDAALEDGLLRVESLGHWLAERPTMQHVVITGGSLPPALLDQADTISELRDAKHVLREAQPRVTDPGQADAALDELETRAGRAWQAIDRLDHATGQGRWLVHTGNGKAKSTAAFGKVIRALGHGRRVGIAQFIKGKFTTGERELFAEHPRVTYRVMGQGFTWETQNRGEDQANADGAWAEAAALLGDPAIDLVMLDELNNTIKKGYLDIEQVIETLRNRPAHQDVIVTGRNARPAMMAAADAVTQVRKKRHAFDAGYRAQKGIDL
ncbi:MAG: cob(I)yrinic acid a,c-diamide adenosyltransferase [Halofilum sp. (in: g-proteobacteria)]